MFTPTAGIIDDVLDGVQERAASALAELYHSLVDPLFGWLSNPLIWWGLRGAAVIAACFVIGWFFGFKWVRAVLGAVVVLVLTFLAGMYQMHKEMVEKAKQNVKKRGK